MIDELLGEGLPVLPINLMSSVKMRESHGPVRRWCTTDPRHKLSQQFVELHDLLESAG